MEKAFYLNTAAEPHIGDSVFRYGENDEVDSIGENT